MAAEQRQYVANLYHGPRWKKRVEKMPDDQVTAIYLKHVNDGSIAAEFQPEQEHLVEVPRDPHLNEDDFPTY